MDANVSQVMARLVADPSTRVRMHPGVNVTALPTGGVRVECGTLAIEPGWVECGDRREPCPECAPHGGKGKVALFSNLVDCTTCVATCQCGGPLLLDAVCHGCATAQGVCGDCGQLLSAVATGPSLSSPCLQCRFEGVAT